MTELPAAPEPLGVPTTDAHTHLGTTEQKSGLVAADAVERAASVGVHRLVDVGYDVDSSRLAVGVAEQHDAVVATVAIHPTDAAQLGDDLDEALRELEALLGTSDRIRGVGETGLDFHWIEDEAGRARQREAFAAHIGWAKEHDLALVIHDRDAHAEVLKVLAAEGWPERVQMHCFSGDAAHARACLEHGAWLSYPGTVTFKANDVLREAARITPRDRILAETDAPYLTPVPARGRPNASYLLPHTVRFLADLRGEDPDDLAAVLDANATALFGDWGHDG
ncbi:MAG TPA: TatD family hydrolase [Propionibacterium sp.]|nr:TatD family hydrolase [Propionibacterium sp.]